MTITHINAPGLSATVIALTPETTREESKQLAWEMMCNAHPVEAHDFDPDKFWQFFHMRRPDVSREQMIQWLNEYREAQ